MLHLEGQSVSLTNVTQSLRTERWQHLDAHYSNSKSPHTQKKTSIKGCLQIFTLFIHGLSPVRSIVFQALRPRLRISFISAQGALLIKLQYTTYILGCQCSMLQYPWKRVFQSICITINQRQGRSLQKAVFWLSDLYCFSL